MRWRTIYIFVQHVSSRVPKGKEYSGLEPSFFVKGQGHNRRQGHNRPHVNFCWDIFFQLCPIGFLLHIEYF